MPHVHLAKFPPISGVAVQNVKKDEYFFAWVKGGISSDDSNFSTIVTNLTSGIFNKLGVIEESVLQFLLIQHTDLSADIWINDFNRIMEARVKRSIKKGESLPSNNIADIRQLKFPDIEIAETDNIIFCFKVGWKFHLYIDLTRSIDPTTNDELYLALGLNYKKVVFKYLFDLFSKKDIYLDIFKNGWFPYIELIGNEYEQLLQAYATNFGIEEKVEKIIKSFNKERIKKITDKWWDNHYFLDQKDLLLPGIKSLKANSFEGNYLASKVFYTQAEGLIRQSLFEEEKTNPRTTHILWEFMENRAKVKAGCESSLFFETSFSEFLQKHVYKGFNLEEGSVELSRNSISHGVAKTNEYTRDKAVQGLLILDQLFFYLS
jgi:hypothetical protein